MAGDHKCPVCQATFTRPQHVARHMRSHTGDRPYKCQHCGDQFARSDLLSRHINKCHASEKPPTTSAPNQRRKGAAAACRATTSKQACDQCVQSTLPCDGANPCSKCVQRKCRCTYVKFHRQTAPSGPGHQPPPRAVSELDGSVQPYSNGPRYAQTGADYLPVGADTASLALAGAAGGLSSLYGSAQHQYAFNPQLAGYGPHDGTQQLGGPGAGALDPSSQEFAIRYRQQAELLRRAGVLPPASVAVAPDVNSINAGLVSGLYNDSLAGVQGRYSNQNGAQGWNGERNVQQQQQPQQQGGQMQYGGNGAGSKDMDQYDQYGYVDAASRHQLLQRQQQQQQQQYNNGYAYQQHARHASMPDNHARRNSVDLSNSDGTNSVNGSVSSAASSHIHLPLDMGGSQRNSYASSSSRPSTAESPASSSRQLPLPHQQGHSRQGSDVHHDGFSSAFGLMSLDDPAVLAGLASDSQPFFSTMGMPTPTPAKEREMRERAMNSLFPSTSGGGGKQDERARDGGIGPLSAREVETRELRDFWKQYMRTPLSGGGPLGGITPGLSSALGAGAAGGILASGAAARPGPPKRGLSRVASLPSVKTPGIGLRESYASGAEYDAAGGQGAYNASQMPAPAVPAGRTYTNSDDLKSYEAAVMSRKAPMTLNLQPRRGRAGSVVGMPSLTGGHQGYSNMQHDSSSSPEMQHVNAAPIDMSRPGSTAAVYGGSRAGSSFDAGANDSRPSSSYALRGDSMLRPPSVMTDDGSAGSDTDGSGGAGAAGAGAGRPSFKRLASQTLGPAHTKRAMVAFEDGSSPLDGDDEDEGTYEPQAPRQVADIPERYRRLSAPTAPGLVEGGYA